MLCIGLHRFVQRCHVILVLLLGNKRVEIGAQQKMQFESVQFYVFTS